MAAPPMVHLMTAGGAFHGRLVAARLGAEGILTELRGALDGPYPAIGTVEVYVDASNLEAARQILLADAVDAAFDESGAELLEAAYEAPPKVDSLADEDPYGRSRPHRALFVMTAVAVVTVMTVIIVMGVLVDSGVV
jgi:hypothetical protein